MDNSTEKDFDSNNSGLSKAWQLRFKFYEENGLPKFKPTAQYKENCKALSRSQSFTINYNIFALFFGPLYFLCLGMWRKAITLWVFITVVFVILSILGIPLGVYYAFSGITSAYLANSAYYLHRVKESKSFNIFEGFF